MGTSRVFWKSLQQLMFLIALLMIAESSNYADEKDVYIVYMGNVPESHDHLKAQHITLLEDTLGRERAAEAWLYSYTRSFNGFVAEMTEQEGKKMADVMEVVSVFYNTIKKPHTTRSWDFLGMGVNFKRSQMESKTILGIMDTGIWPESASFNDEGYGPPPKNWKGTCQQSSHFNCNNKIVGARFYNIAGLTRSEDILSPRDTDGHGTHMASIAAGGLVTGANLYGLASGTARGGVPSARISIYKTCWSFGCTDADILAAFDDAIADGVHIISLSVGADSSHRDFFEDSIAIGAFHAMKKGILTINSAGNSGPELDSISNVSPWSLSVAATTIDRKFLAQVQLGNGKSYEGLGVNTFEAEEHSFSLVYGGYVPSHGANAPFAKYCKEESLDSKQVNGTIVLCMERTDGSATAAVGAAGIIIEGNCSQDMASSYVLPGSYVRPADGDEILRYIDEASEPRASIFKSRGAKDMSAPVVASFSSRGPHPMTRDFLKPDIAAPGVDILAAWSEANTVTGDPQDKRVVPYNIISGTSMSCSHASGSAAYVKSFHPTWSPAAIKSALMTTAYNMDPSKHSNDLEFAYGSGQVDPAAALDPGLIFNASETDYINFLCEKGYNKTALRLVTGDNSITCLNTGDLNYPSFLLDVDQDNPISGFFTRTLTNVGPPTSTYTAIVHMPPLVNVTIEPSILRFSYVGETFIYSECLWVSHLTSKTTLRCHRMDGCHPLCQITSCIIQPQLLSIMHVLSFTLWSCFDV